MLAYSYACIRTLRKTLFGQCLSKLDWKNPDKHVFFLSNLLASFSCLVMHFIGAQQLSNHWGRICSAILSIVVSAFYFLSSLALLFRSTLRFRYKMLTSWFGGAWHGAIVLRFGEIVQEKNRSKIVPLIIIAHHSPTDYLQNWNLSWSNADLRALI